MRGLIPCLTLALVAVPAAAADCTTARDQAQAANQMGDVTSLKALFTDAASCDPSLGDWVGRRIATLEYNAAVAARPVDEARLVASLAFGRPWQTLATLGDLATDRKDRVAAARYYQDALVEIDDPVRTPKAPPTEQIMAVRKKAEIASLLSPTYVAMAKARDGSTSGLGAVTLRGIGVTTTALPIWFEFGRAEFSAEGRKAVDEVVGMLRTRSTDKPVTLVGHTDAVGDAIFNRRLSLQRAQRVRGYLAGRGVAVPMRVEGRGEDEPYLPDDASKYSEQELAQMSRRVQLVLD